jgi:hypothetical protein
VTVCDLAFGFSVQPGLPGLVPLLDPPPPPLPPPLPPPPLLVGGGLATVIVTVLCWVVDPAALLPVTAQAYLPPLLAFSVGWVAPDTVLPLRVQL